jgi:hypothetical protein
LKLLHIIVGALAAWAAPAVVAQQVYRCGPDGNFYQQTPCKEGQAIDVADPRSADQQKSGRAAAKADAKLANELERDRRTREGPAPPPLASGFNARPVPADPAPSAPAKKKKKNASAKASG